MEEQLTMSMNQLVRPKPKSSSKNLAVDDEPLPRTLYDALSPSSRAIVVTETSNPFRVVDVNKAWEGLCEYSYFESKGKSLGDLLKGPETDPLTVTSLVSQLLKGEDVSAIVTNYTKSGRKFRNRLHVGPLYDDHGSVTHFVGVLQEVQM
jgi:PAS domain S-box-containing protein